MCVMIMMCVVHVCDDYGVWCMCDDYGVWCMCVMIIVCGACV